MQLNCGNCGKASGYLDWMTERENILRCPLCSIQIATSPKNEVLKNGQEVYGNEIRLLNDVPKLINEAGDNSKYAWDEFFNAHLSNINTRRAYKRIVVSFLDWADLNNKSLTNIMPGDISNYLISCTLQLSSKKQIVSALRHFFDFQVNRHAMLINPASSIRLERMVYRSGKTKALKPEVSKRIISSIEINNVRDLRDRCILGILTFTACRINALRKIELNDYILDGYQAFLKLYEKNGAVRMIPVRAELRKWIDEYIKFSCIESGPLLQSFIGKNLDPSNKFLSESSIKNILCKYFERFNLTGYTAHSFRAGAATELLEQGVAQEDVQILLGHADPRTTQLYDKRKKEVSQNIVERI